MKIKLTFLVLFLSTISGFSQEITYTLFWKDPCSHTIERSINYHLEKDGKKFDPSSLENPTIILPTLGEYKLFAKEIGEIHKVKIQEVESSDTLVIPRIQEFLITHSRPDYIFRDCDKPLEGKVTDYYSDGSIRMVGNFKKGLVIGKLKKYYQNGKIKEISTYDKDGALATIKRFDETGEIIEE